MIDKDIKLEIREAVKYDLPSILALYAQSDMDNGQVLTLEHAETVFAKMQTHPDYKVCSPSSFFNL